MKCKLSAITKLKKKQHQKINEQVQQQQNTNIHTKRRFSSFTLLLSFFNLFFFPRFFSLSLANHYFGCI